MALMQIVIQVVMDDIQVVDMCHWDPLGMIEHVS